MNETRENGAKGTKIMATTRQGKKAHTRDSKSKQKNTAIFGAKNIDLLDLCTMSNNNTEQRNCATKQKKKRKNNGPKAESSAERCWNSGGDIIPMVYGPSFTIFNSNYQSIWGLENISLS